MALVLDFDSVLSTFQSSPSRVVSLVPSSTDSMFAFELASTLVGITDYCEFPSAINPQPERIGGPKNPDISKIVALNPDLIIANREENDRESVEQLVAADLILWLTFPKTVADAIQDLWHLVRLFKIERAAAPQLETLERISEWTQLAEPEHIGSSFFCPIWQSDDQDWWMTFNSETYANDILIHCGGRNVFSERKRNYPLKTDLGVEDGTGSEGGDTRYPRVKIDDIRETKPDVILLPSEPYHFGEDHIEMFKTELEGIPAVETGSIFLVDGRLITWHGIRIAEALVELPRYFR
jgi:ABC-type Fe3+-hydroxamate transport system substrate-binding protein